ncbi:MAG TPA: hypothetical protein VMV27_13040 [Candidatus Binataceae bacterium]|nr:hypothetical protein [Candidatus Binataceae bacterium]
MQEPIISADSHINIWQVAAGDGSRDYADVFLRFGVILVGPGSLGNYFTNKDAYNKSESGAYRSFLEPFAEKISVGDLVALKRPRSDQWEIVAIGEVRSDYVHQEVFEDVEGWDLQHCREVHWKVPDATTLVSGLTRGTLKRVYNEQALTEIRRIWASGRDLASEPIPAKSEPITVDEVIESLIVDGLPGQRAELIAKTIWRLRRMAKYYGDHGAEVGEHEIRTFLIVPLLMSLGWAEQRVKIEWGNMDVVLFDTPYKKGSKPVMIIESKRLFDGMRYAPEQAKGYARSFPSCDRFVVSDGIRYKLFRREGDDWRYAAYMSLTAPKRNHPYERTVEGAVAFFRSVIPSGIS